MRQQAGAQSRSAGRDSSLDAVKGMMILLVIATHASWTSATRANPFFPYVIDMAVPVFMIITGYVNAASLERRGVHGVRDCLTAEYVLRRAVAYTVPFIGEFAAMIAVGMGEYTTLSQFAFAFLRGDPSGCGSYYYPVLMWSIVFVPVACVVVREWRHGLATCLCLSLAYELSCTAWGLDVAVYRLAFPRYFFAVALGAWLRKVEGGGFPRSRLCAAAVVGSAAFIAAVSWLGFSPVVLVNWTTTSIATFPWACALFCAMRALCRWMAASDEDARIRAKPSKGRLAALRARAAAALRDMGARAVALLAVLGRRSYTIMLCQIVYWAVLAPHLYALGLHNVVVTLAGWAVCCAAGVPYGAACDALCRAITTRVLARGR